MGDIFASIRHCLANLLRFSGRDTRQRFWPYAIFIVLLAWAISYVVMLPELMRMFGEIARVAAEQPDPNMTPEQIEATVYGAMPDFGFILLVTFIVNLVAAALLAAAAARRLHDCDRTGLWALLPLPSLVAGYLLAPRDFRQAMRVEELDGLRLQIPAMMNSVLLWGLLILLIVLMAQAGTEGPNRFGPPPQQA
jgi:uncharacterized membrane protein YhaH (DUF805 family)